MLTTISSIIPPMVREGFDVKDLPARATTLTEEILAQVLGGQNRCPPTNCINGGNSLCLQLSGNPSCQCAFLRPNTFICSIFAR